MRQNTYIVLHRDPMNNEPRHDTFKILVDDPLKIEETLYELVKQKLILHKKAPHFFLDVISLIDSVEIKPTLPPENGIQFSSDRDTLVEGQKYLVRYNDHEYCIGIYRNETLIEVESDLPIQWGSTIPLSWCGPLP